MYFGGELSDAETVQLARLPHIPLAGRDALPQALAVLLRAIPLLLNAGVNELKQLCLSSNCRLFSANAEELRNNVDLSPSSGSLRISMGINSRNFVDSQGLSAVRLLHVDEGCRLWLLITQSSFQFTTKPRF